MNQELNPYETPSADCALSPGVGWARDVSSSLKWTKVGLTLVYVGIVLLLLSAILLIGSFFLGRPLGPGTFVALLGIAGFGMLLAQILMMAGPLFCLAVPSESGAKGFIIGAVVLQMLSLAAAIGRQFAPGAIPVPANLALNSSGLFGIVLFALFMKRLSEYIGRKDLAAQARNVLAGIASLVILGALMFAGMATEMFGFAIVSSVLILGGLIVFIMYANLVNALRKALGTKNDAQGAEA